MDIYMFFKKYYINMWKNLAIYLWNKWWTPNKASLISVLIIFPLFYIISTCQIFNTITIFTILFFISINVKLILNAIDWIIAREKNIKTNMWMYLNVWTDIWPDIFIIYLLLVKLWMLHIMVPLISLIIIYLILEFLFIFLFNKQNLFFWKDLRTFFYLVIFILYFTLWVEYAYLLVNYYLFALLIHNVWYFLPKYRN